MVDGFAPSAGTFAKTATRPRSLPIDNSNFLVPSTSRLLSSSSEVIPERQIASDELLDLYNTQVTNELEASQLYLAASIWCEKQELTGMAAYMRAESDEEREHALTLIDFANKRNIPIKLEDIEAPDSDWKSPQELWKAMLEAEMENTKALLRVADAAIKCNDHAVTTLFQPYHMVRFEFVASMMSFLERPSSNDNELRNWCLSLRSPFTGTSEFGRQAPHDPCQGSRGEQDAGVAAAARYGARQGSRGLKFQPL